MRKPFNPTILCTLVAVVVLAYGLRPPAREPSVQIDNASGEVQLTNSRDGSAIFQTGNLAPGQQVSGTVQLTNSGSGAGALDISPADLVDNPGPGLGLLSSALDVTIRDVTNPSTPVQVFSGPTAALGTHPLGTLAPGESRTYSFTATLPAAGTNAVSGSSMSVRYVWTLTGSGGGSGGGGSIAGGGGGSGGSGVASMPVSVKVNAKKAKKGSIAVKVTCGLPCRLSAYAAAKGKPAVRTRRKAGQVKLPGKSATIKLRLSKAGIKALRKRLTKRKKLTLTVTVKATDSNGAAQTVVAKATVKR